MKLLLIKGIFSLKKMLLDQFSLLKEKGKKMHMRKSETLSR